MLTWTFPWMAGISSNNLYPSGARGRRILKMKAVMWRDLAILQIRESGATLPDCARLAFRLDFWPPRGLGPDCSNCLKLVEDSVFAAFGFDDSLIWDTRAVRHEPDGTPRIVVQLGCSEGGEE